MEKVLEFYKEPEISDLEGLSINEATFKVGRGMIIDSEVLLMEIPNTFRFTTKLEILKTDDGRSQMVMTQFLSRGPELWAMGEAFSRIGFRNPEIEEQMRVLCDELIKKGLAKWIA